MKIRFGNTDDVASKPRKPERNYLEGDRSNWKAAFEWQENKGWIEADRSSLHGSDRSAVPSLFV
jgi:hypothetical protein